MSAPAKCPLCDTKLRPDWESCPNCPMSFRDAPPEKTTLQGDAFRSYGIPLMIFGGIAYFVWTIGAYMLRIGEDNAKSGGAAIVKQAVTGNSPAPAGVVPTDSAGIQGLVDEQTTGKFERKSIAPKLVSASAEEQGLGTISIMPSKGPKQQIVNDWKMRGVVYDLITLKPSPGAILTFTDNMTNSRAQVTADARGRYKALLPPLVGRGYVVTLFKVGYEKTCLDPRIEGVGDLPLSRRRELAKELASMISPPFAFEPGSEEPQTNDFYLAPR
jgi:hypothetical protein